MNILGIKDTLLTVPQREDGGRTAYDRFDYQTAWGLSQMLDLHRNRKNYAIAFEFHDDIVSLDDADNPTNAVFYQIKTKISGNWSFARITSRPKSKNGKKSSHAGKMFDNLIRFGATVERLVFVSNQPLPEVIIVHGEQGFSLATRKKLQEFVTALAAETPDFVDAEHTSLFFFSFSDLNLTNYESTVLGRIADLLSAEVGDHIPPKPFALTLNDHCRKRSKSLADISDFDQLRASKFVTRSDMITWLAQAQNQHEKRPEWAAVSLDLQVPLAEKVRIERAWTEYEILLRARSNAATIAFSYRVRAIVDEAMERVDDLSALVNVVFAVVRPMVVEWELGASDHLVKAIILYELKR